ncbi:tetratricopeptide repeat protein [Methyloceanibacter sp.]|uniref:tetratricopeptide repeat protein n=1 Tax=Methyloceanibacter sp. TaxID=1965321 RepID=UPI003D6D7A40
MWSLRATSCARKLALPARLLGILFLIIAGLINTEASALSDQREASLKATHGRAAILRGQYQEAERLLTEALSSGALAVPTEISALGNRGIARWRLNDPQAAVDDFNAALRLSPEEAMIYNNRGNVLLDLRHYEEAAKDFSQAIALIPNYGQAYNNRGNARFLLGDQAASIADYTKAVALMPGNAVPFNGRGKAQLALKRPAGAMRDFSRAIVLNARYGQAYANRAEALMALRRYADAANDYSSAIEYGVETTEVYLGRAAAYTALNKPWKGYADLARARERDPALAPAAAEQTGSLPESVKASPAANSPCEGADQLGDGSESFAQTAEARRSPPPNSLLLHASNEVLFGTAEPEGPSDRIEGPCDEDDKQATDTPSPGDRPVSTELEGWTVALTEAGQYVATNSDYPKLRLGLEMYGAGEPEVLNWQVLKGTLRGIGLLHYYAGASPEGARLEYIAVVDLWAKKLMAIEPGRWGELQAQWAWSDSGVVVVDPQGVPSRVEVRNAAQTRVASYERPAHLKRIKRVSRPVLPRFSYRPARRMMPFRYGFNPYAFR